MSTETLQIKFEDSVAEVALAGCALISLSLSGSAVIPEPAKPYHPYHGVMLAPWPNRVAGGNYQFGGQAFKLEINEDFGNALHGLLFSSVARVRSHSESALVLESEITPNAGYPCKLLVEISFELSGSGLRVQTSAKNLSQRSCPVGLGTHPFFLFDEDSTLEIRAGRAAIHGSDMMPIDTVDARSAGFGTGAPRAINRLSLDVQFSEMESVAAVLRTQDWAIEIWQERADWLMVYTTEDYNWADGRKRAVAIEPQTCAADAFNNSAGLVVLEPGQQTSYVWGVSKTAN